jgi:hypothetical protein
MELSILERPLDVKPPDIFTVFYGTQRFISAFTGALNLFLS